jgi:hypothetical protein
MSPSGFLSPSSRSRFPGLGLGGRGMLVMSPSGFLSPSSRSRFPGLGLGGRGMLVMSPSGFLSPSSRSRFPEAGFSGFGMLVMSPSGQPHSRLSFASAGSGRVGRGGFSIGSSGAEGAGAARTAEAKSAKRVKRIWVDFIVCSGLWKQVRGGELMEYLFLVGPEGPPMQWKQSYLGRKSRSFHPPPKLLGRLRNQMLACSKAAALASILDSISAILTEYDT